jgi:hypothetical protein
MGIGLPTVKVEIAFDSGYATPAASRTWTDVTSYVKRDPGINFTFGRQDERSTADANHIDLTLINSDGRFTPGNASSPYYPNVKLGRPVRVTTTTPPASDFNLLTAAQSSFESSTGGWVAGGTVLPTLTSDATRAVFGTKSLKIHWNGSGSFPQGQLTLSGKTAGATYTWAGWVYVPTGSPDVRLAGGTTVGDFITAKDQWVWASLTYVAPGTTPTIAVRSLGTAGDVWLDGVMHVSGSAVGDYNTVAQSTQTRICYADSWPVSWPATVSTYAASQLSASSRLARLGLSSPLRSIVEQEYLSDSPEAYWTMAETQGAIAASDSSGNGHAVLEQAGGTGTAVTFGTATGPGTDDLTAASFSGGKYLRSWTSGLFRAFGEPLTLEAFVNCSATATDSLVIGLYGNTDVMWGIRIDSAGKALAFTYDFNAFGGASAFQNTITSTTTIEDGQTHHLALTFGAATFTLWVDGVSEGTYSGSITALWNASKIYVGGIGGAGNDLVAFTGTIAHAAITRTALSSTRIAAHANAGLTGFAGETPGARFTRYARFGSVPTAEISADTGTSPMAHVLTNDKTVVEMISLVETTDGGVVFDAADNTLTFQGRAHRYNAAVSLTLDVSAGEVDGDFEPRLDHSSTLNIVTATTSDGTVSAEVRNQASIDDYGEYSDSLELATTDPGEPLQAASWRVNTYSQPTARITSLSVDLRNLSMSQQATLLGLTVGSHIQVNNQPSQAPTTTGHYFVEGYTESIDEHTHRFTLNVSPAEQWLNIFAIGINPNGAIDSGYRLAY